MFIGHFAVGFASKRLAPGTSLVPLMAAPIFLDLLWPIFLLLGWERVRIDPGNTVMTPLDFVHYPITHSLLTALGWGLLFALVHRACGGYRRGALVLGIGVVSHWILDAIVHRPDLPLYPGSGSYVGLGLWNSPAVTIVIESAMFVAGVLVYIATTRPRGWLGHVSLASLVALLAFLYVGNLTGPPPKDERSLAFFGLTGWITIPWVYWIERTRELRRGR